MIDSYLPFVVQTLEKFPSLTASRLYEMVRERGYHGSPHHFRHLVSLHRPRRPAEAFLRLSTLPGEQAQVDWGHFGYLEIGRARRPLMAFVMVLSYSRDIYLRFFLDARMENFLRGHVGAFNTWCGLPKVLLYDNLKSAVLERQGDAIRFHPTLLAFAGHYRFEPRPVAPARGNEKGRVERAIRHIREAFFAARTFTDLADLNAQAERWCRGQAADRPCPEDREMTVREALAREQPFLLPLPDNPYPVEERIASSAASSSAVIATWIGMLIRQACRSHVQLMRRYSRFGCRWIVVMSSPSSNACSRSVVIVTTSVFLSGQVKRSASRRFISSQKPFPSQPRILIRSRRRLPNT